MSQLALELDTQLRYGVRLARAITAGVKVSGSIRQPCGWITIGRSCLSQWLHISVVLPEPATLKDLDLRHIKSHLGSDLTAQQRQIEADNQESVRHPTATIKRNRYATSTLDLE